MQQGACNHHRRTGQSGNGVKIGAQHGWNFGDKDIAHHASAYPRHHAEECRHNRIHAEGQRFLGAGHGEERQSPSVEQKDGVAPPVDAGSQQKVSTPAKRETADIASR